MFKRLHKFIGILLLIFITVSFTTIYLESLDKKFYKKSTKTYDRNSVDLNYTEVSLGKVMEYSEDFSSIYKPFVGDDSRLNVQAIKTESIEMNSFKLAGKTTFISPKIFKLGEFKTTERLAYAIKYLDITTGLPSNKIVSITEDEQRNTWICYKGGVAKLVSNFIFVYDASSGLPDFPFTQMVYYKKAIYLGTFGGGLVKLNENSYTQYTKKTGFPTDIVLSLASSPTKLYAGTYGEGVLGIEGLNYERYSSPTFDKKSHRIVSSLYYQRGKLYALMGDGFTVLTNSKLNVYSPATGIPADEYQSIVVDNAGGILIGAASNFLIKISPNKITNYKKYKRSINKVNHLFKARSGSVYLSTSEEGLYTVLGNKYYIISKSEGLTDNHINMVFQDSYTNLWLATQSKGVSLISPSNFFNLENENATITSICSTPANELVYKSHLGGIVISSPTKKVRLFHPKLDIISAIQYDEKRQVFWLGSQRGLFKLNNGELFQIIPKSELQFSVTSILVSSKGDLWINDFNHGVFELKPDKLSYYPNWVRDFNSHTQCSFEDKANNIWIGSADGVLSCFKGDEIQTYSLAFKNQPVKFLSIEQDGHGKLFFGTNIGLFTLENGLFKKIPVQASLKNERITSLLYSDFSKTLWVGTQSGLYALSNKKTRFYSEVNGIKSSSFNLNACLETASNEIYWGTDGGLLKYIPFEFENTKIKRKIQLIDIVFTDEQKNEKKSVNIQKAQYEVSKIIYDLNNLTIKISCPNWGKESHTNYYYRTSEEGDWINLGSVGQLTLENIYSGSYKIDFKAELSDGVESEIVSFEFEILKPFYFETWFLITMSLVFLFIVWYVINKFSSFNFDNVKNYGFEKALVQKVRLLLAATFFIGFGLEYVYTSLLEIYQTNWVFNGILIFIGAVVILITIFYKTKAYYLNKLLQLAFTIICVIAILKAYQNDFAPILSLTAVVIFVYAVIIFQDVKTIFLFSIAIMLMVFLSVSIHDKWSVDSALFVAGTFQALVIIFIFALIENKKLERVIFSDKILKNSEQFILVADKNAKIVFANKYLTEAFGVQESDVLNDGWWKLRNTSDLEILQIKSDLIEALKNGKSTRYMNSFYNEAEQKTIFIEWTDTPIENQYILGIGKDVTNERIQKIEIDKKIEDARIITEIGKEIISSLAIEEIIDKTYASISKLLGAEMLGIGLYDESTASLVFEGGIEKGVKLPTTSHSLAESKRISVQCFLNQVEFFSNDAQNDFEIVSTFDIEGDLPKSLIYLPLTKQGKKIGVITIQNFNNLKFSEYQFQLFKNIAIYSAIAIDNSSLYAQLEAKVEERTSEIKSAYENTKVLSEISKEISSCITIEAINRTVYNRVDKLMDTYSFGIGIYNPENGHLEWEAFMEGEKASDFISYSIEEENRLASICFKTEKELLINDYSKEYINYIKEIPSPMFGVTPESIIYIPLFNKDTIFGCLTVQSLTKNVYTDYHINLLKNLAVSISIAIDNANMYKNLEGIVLERTAKLEHQKVELEKLSIVAENVNNGVIITDANNHIEWANASVLKLLEYELNEIEGSSPIEKFSGIDHAKELMVQANDSSMNGFEMLFFSKSGKPIWVLINITPITNEANTLVKGIYVITDISEDKKLKTRFDYLLNNAADIIYTTAIDGELTYINKALFTILGYEPSNFVGQHFSKIVYKEDKAAFIEFFESISSTPNENAYQEFRVLASNGDLKWVAQKVNFTYDDFSVLNGFQAIVRDIDVIKKAEEIENNRLALESYYSKVLTDLSFEQLSNYENIEALYAEICDRVADTLEVERVSVWEFEKDTFYCKSINKAENSLAGVRLKMADYAGFIDNLFEGLIISESNVINNEDFKDGADYFDTYNVGAILAYPIRFDGKVVGILSCEKVGDSRIWLDQDESFVKLVADIITINIEASKRILIERQIKESEANFRLLNETIEDVFWLLDTITKKVIYISPSCQRILGPSQEEFYSTENYWQNYILEEDKPNINIAHQLIISEGYYEVEYRIKNPASNEIKWIFEKSFGIKNEQGVIVKSSGICSDITLQKQTQIALANSENNFRLINENLNDVFFLHNNIEDKFDYISTNCKTILGKEDTYFYEGGPIVDGFVFEDDRPLVRKAYDEINDGVDYEIEYRIIVGKEIRWMREKSVAIKNEAGIVYKNSGICSDITEEKLVDEKIKQLSLVAEKTSNGVTISDAFGKVLWANQSYLDMFEIPFDKLVGNQPRLLFNTNDVELHQKLEQLNKIHQGYTMEIQALTYLKKPIWIELINTPILDNNGDTIQVEVVNNITERKIKEQIIETQNEDIISSITYAKRIQGALLTHDDFITSLPIQTALIYKPKDIIGGDFYWFEQVDDKIIIAIGDCTGHGVPGALMTSVGINGLINSVTEKRITDPATILTYIDEYVFGLLSYSDEKVSDGMDLAIVTIDTKTKAITFAGAGRPLIYIKDNELTRIQGARKAIASRTINANFENHVIEATNGCTFHLFSDGMTDQFGGSNQKRIGSNHFYDLLLANANLPLETQKNSLIDFFNDWDADNNQTDDMIWCGFRI